MNTVKGSSMRFNDGMNSAAYLNIRNGNSQSLYLKLAVAFSSDDPDPNSENSIRDPGAMMLDSIHCSPTERGSVGMTPRSFKLDIVALRLSTCTPK